ncbi:MAG: 3-carboxy-cis,cis-muconate cycloisomerase [Lactobacillus sp.]|nr:3-carboxy-cis,cis-muconate cycloisomerase [Lactobacillus sp.]
MASGEMLGSIFNQNEYSTARMRAIWTDENRLAVICQTEIALAQAMADNHKIPQEAVAEIKEVMQPKNFDLRKLRLAVARNGHFLAGLIEYVQPLFQHEGGQYLHYGAASEDIEDTAYVLQLKQAHQLIVDYVQRICQRLSQLVADHQQDLCAAIAHRTYGAYTTLGFKLGIFLNDLENLLTKLEHQAPQSFCGSLANGDGLSTMVGDHSDQVEADFCRYLNLNTPEMYWHTQRERFCDYTHFLTEIAQVLGRLAKELLYMSQTSVQEFSEPYAPGRQGSTVIPTSREPYMCESMLNLSTVIRNEMTLMYDQMLVSGEKDTAVWRDLYVAMPEICMYLSGQLNYALVLLTKGQFNIEKMRNNLQLDDGTMYSGALMVAMSSKIGRQKAHDLLYQMRVEADAQGKSLRVVIENSPRIGAVLSADELQAIMTPSVEHIPNALFKVQKILQLFKQHHPELQIKENK